MKVLLLILAFASVGFSQTMPARIAASPNPKDIGTTYDKFKNRTVVRVKGFSRATKGSKAGIDELNLMAAFAFEGDTLTSNIGTFGLTFSGARDFTFFRNKRLIFLLDGDRIDLGEGHRDSTDFILNDRESVYFNIPRDVFEKIVKADKIEMQVGPFEGKIDNSTLYRTTRKLKELFDLGTAR